MGQRVLWAFRRQPPVESDEQLTERVRHGDGQAFGELYRRHCKVAESTACFLLRSRSDADDVVAEAFAGVLAAIRNGRGPRDNFRTYLLACVRNGCRGRRPLVHAGCESPVDDRETSSVTFEDPERYVEADTVARAFATLNPRWQQTLWLSEVEQRPTSELGEYFKLSPNATAALTRRAREAFATAYLAEHVGAAPNAICSRFADRLAAYVRDQLSDSQRAEVEQHLVGCERCSAAAADLRDVNTSLRTLTPAPSALTGVEAAAQLTFSAASMGGASTGLFGGGLLLKGAAAILVLAPVLVVTLPLVTDGERQPAEVERADNASIADDVQPLARPDDEAPTSIASAQRPTATASGAVPVVTSSSPLPASTAPLATWPRSVLPAGALGLLRPIQSLADHLLADVVDRVVPTVLSAAVTVIDDVSTTVDAGLANVLQLVGELSSPPELDVAASIIEGVDDPAPTALPGVVSPATLPPLPAVTTPVPNPAPPAAPITAPLVSVAPITVPVVSIAPITVPVISVAPITVPGLLD